MTWNYRVIRRVTPYHWRGEDGVEIYDQIAEVFYDETETPIGWGPASPGSILEDEDAKTVDGLRIVLERMLTALDKPILAEDLTEWVDEAGDGWKVREGD